MKVKTLAPWFGSDRSKAESLGRMFDGCAFVMIPFGGGFSIVPHLRARTIVCNDKHRHIINLARMISNPHQRARLQTRLHAVLFHPQQLADSQRFCSDVESGDIVPEPEVWAFHYFVCAWMARSASAGTKKEFEASYSIRYDAGGGDSVLRFRNAADAIDA